MQSLAVTTSEKSLAAGERGAVLLSQAGDEPKPAQLAKHEMTWAQHRDSDGAIGRNFGIHFIPSYLVVGSDGVMTSLFKPDLQQRVPRAMRLRSNMPCASRVPGDPSERPFGSLKALRATLSSANSTRSRIAISRPGRCDTSLHQYSTSVLTPQAGRSYSLPA